MLNYIVTSNHPHLLVLDTEEKVLPKSLQLIAGRTAQEFNKRKNRKGQLKSNSHRTEAVAVGSERFVKNIKNQLGSRAEAKTAEPTSGGFALKETQASYNTLLEDKKDDLKAKNRY